MLDINIEAKYNDSTINIRIKANKQGGDEKNQIFYKKYDLFAAATCDQQKKVLNKNSRAFTHIEN